MGLSIGILHGLVELIKTSERKKGNYYKKHHSLFSLRKTHKQYRKACEDLDLSKVSKRKMNPLQWISVKMINMELRSKKYKVFIICVLNKGKKSTE